jgi:hypothetical protein
MKLSVFIPVYNEENTIKENISRILDTLKSTDRKFELLVVNDASTDNTLKTLREISGIKIINYTNGPTRRENLAKSFASAHGDIIMFMDADLSVDLRHVNRLIEEIENGADISIGSRYMGIRSTRSVKRLLISMIYNKIIGLFFDSHIKDHNCGFKAFNKKVLPLIKEMGFDMNRGWFWDAELLIRAQKKGHIVKEFPVSWHHGKKSSFKIKKEIRMIPYIISLKWKLK